MQMLSHLILLVLMTAFFGCGPEEHEAVPEQHDEIVTDANNVKTELPEAPAIVPTDPIPVAVPVPVVPNKIVPISNDFGGNGANHDACPTDPNKFKPGFCGCGVPDDDVDNDGFVRCRDNCPDDANEDQKDRDGDGVGAGGMCCRGCLHTEPQPYPPAKGNAAADRSSTSRTRGFPEARPVLLRGSFNPRAPGAVFESGAHRQTGLRLAAEHCDQFTRWASLTSGGQP